MGLTLLFIQQILSQTTYKNNKGDLLLDVMILGMST